MSIGPHTDETVGRLFMDPDADKIREFFRSKPRALVDKRMNVRETETTSVLADSAPTESQPQSYMRFSDRIRKA